jgi:hypothetical protein
LGSAQADLAGEYNLEQIGTKLVLLTGADTNWGKRVDDNFDAFRSPVGQGPFPFVLLSDWNQHTKFGPYNVNPDSGADVTTGSNSSAYAQVRFKFLHDRVQLTAAERKIWQNEQVFHRGTGTTTQLDTKSPMLPTYSLLIKPQSWLSFYATRSEHIEPETEADLYLGIRASVPTDVPLSDPKRNMLLTYQPKNTLTEFGAKAQLFGDRLTISLGHFNEEIAGGLGQVPELYTTPDGRTIYLTHQYQTTLVSSGWELEAFGQVSKRLTYMFGAAFGSDSRQTGTFQGQKTTVHLNGVQNEYTGFLTYTFGKNRFQGLSITTGGKLVPSGWRMNSQVVPDDAALIYPKDEYFIDLGITYGFAGKYQLFLQGNNLLHERAAAAGNIASVVPGRQILGGITARF